MPIYCLEWALVERNKVYTFNTLKMLVSFYSKLAQHGGAMLQAFSITFLLGRLRLWPLHSFYYLAEDKSHSLPFQLSKQHSHNPFKFVYHFWENKYALGYIQVFSFPLNLWGVNWQSAIKSEKKNVKVVYLT